LLLGGTTEGYQLAAALADEAGIRTISSLAGRTASPRVPQGEMRVGGFGGARGLSAYLAEQRIDAIIDATHPFAARMGWNAAEAATSAQVPLLRLERPAWQAGPGDRWTEFGDWVEAVAIVRSQARRVLLAIGRQELEPFAAIDTVFFLIRAVEAPVPMPDFAHAEWLLTRGPFDAASERALLEANRIDMIVAKNSGGNVVDGKLAAARGLGLPVVMKRRPARPDLPRVATIDAAIAWVRTLKSR
jgi:precorrin-6A/cobalt-precorrin-6A reductase